MNYRLIVLTSGDSATLEECLDSFRDHVTPDPSSAYFHGDGMEPRAAAYDVAMAFDWPTTVGGPARPHGFCDAVSECWAEAVGPPGTEEHEYVYWLEHDFLHTRPVDLRELAAILEACPELAQMALMRGAVNEQEKAAGGLYESRPGQYEQRVHTLCAPPCEIRGSVPDPLYAMYRRVVPWLEHSAYFTTNVSLMRRQFMAENPWLSDGLPNCEGRFGIGLVEAGYSFGVWGSGEPWVEHIGERSGFGY